MPPKQRSTRQQKASSGLKGDSRPIDPKPTESNNSAVEQKTFKISHDGKEIICERYGQIEGQIGLVFTHGAGGGLSNPATKCFVEGFSRSTRAISFQGTMNLQSRVKHFHAVIDYVGAEAAALGGRSMGARAAVIAASDHSTTHLILVSYPLVGQNGQVRDEILLSIDPDVKVLFISGSSDNMCALPQLSEVRSRMKAKSWLAVVRGADHGMSLKPKEAVNVMREYTGRFAAKWVQNSDEQRSECNLRWNAHEKQIVDEGWKRPQNGSSGAFEPKNDASAEHQSDSVNAEGSQRSAKRARKR